MKKILSYICICSFLVIIFSNVLFAASFNLTDFSVTDDLITYDFTTQTETIIPKEDISSTTFPNAGLYY